MNLKTQYSIIGGSAGAFVLVLVILFLPQTDGEPLPISPIGEQIISNQTNNDDSSGEVADNSADVEDLPTPPPPEEIVLEDDMEIIPIPESTTSSVRSSRSGGGGGGSSSNGNGDDNGDESFMVIPESPIGVIALLGTAIATIGAYAYIKRH